jgi:transcriptional regulator with XRE-family HTH domain
MSTTTTHATLRSTMTLKSPLKVKSSIAKRALGLRKLGRTGHGATRGAQRATRDTRARRNAEMAPNYEHRVMSRAFEPTAIKARELAERRGVSLHALAHELGYADAPPRVRKPVDLRAMSRSALATATGYDITDISRLFARKHPPTISKLARIAAAYGVWLDDMLVAIGW